MTTSEHEPELIDPLTEVAPDADATTGESASPASAGPASAFDLTAMPPPIVPDEPAPTGPPTLSRPLSLAESAPAVVVPGTPAPTLPVPPPRTPPVAGPAPEPSDEPLLVTQPGWGWRALTAFVAGGALVAAGFTVGSRTGDGGTASSTDAVPTTAPLNTVPTTLPPGPDDDEAAAGNRESAEVVAQSLGPSVVQIEFGDSIGSGVIYRDGLILTNEHVITGASEVDIVLRDGTRLNGVVLGSEPNVDIAVITVGEGLGLPIAPLALGETPSVGQKAIAIGSPFQLQQTVTEGIVSAVNRPIPAGQVYTAMLQTDAPINPGNSGGALADAQGRVIGINTAIQTRSLDNVNSGVGFALPIDTAVSVADRLVAGEPIIGGFLGVSGGAAVDGAPGVQIQTLTPNSAAEDAGLLPGDRVLAIDGVPVTRIEELAGLVAAGEPGDRVRLDVVREDQRLAIDVILGQRN